MRNGLMAAAAFVLLASPAAFAQDNDGNAGLATGAVGGAVAGAVVGGPVGAIIGAVAGGALGGAIDAPDDRVRGYVVEQGGESIALEGNLEVGAGLPEVVELREIPDYKYRYAIVNDRRVLVDPGSRKVVYVFE